MNTQTVALVAVGILALVVIYVAGRFRKRLKAELKGPAGTSLSVDASNEQAPNSPAVVVDGATSRKGRIVAVDHGGRGAYGRDLDAYGDIRITSDPGPKGKPRA